MTLTKILGLSVLGLFISAQALASEKVKREDKLFRSVQAAQGSQFVKAQRIEMAPGVAAPVHVHPVPTFGVINQGSIAYQEEGGAEVMLKAGDTFFEPKDLKILKFNNGGDKPAVFTVFYLVEDKDSQTLHLAQ
ncbi:cupin domain-containing protein [Shewanella sp. AS16]|uniref:cupin domain-containing protein n=1 Tax=Shewanella sp. AS16 TaxID=2907625 RepID=UPI001F486EA3|nr:cupin domain-containing protein [Shewanella sp. AS16]MCE9685635.1 cupin domain-containing protein [Shewanella sp. AS16]